MALPFSYQDIIVEHGIVPASITGFSPDKVARRTAIASFNTDGSNNIALPPKQQNNSIHGITLNFGGNGVTLNTPLQYANTPGAKGFQYIDVQNRWIHDNSPTGLDVVPPEPAYHAALLSTPKDLCSITGLAGVQSHPAFTEDLPATHTLYTHPNTTIDTPTGLPLTVRTTTLTYCFTSPIINAVVPANFTNPVSCTLEYKGQSAAPTTLPAGTHTVTVMICEQLHSKTFTTTAATILLDTLNLQFQGIGTWTNSSSSITFTADPTTVVSSYQPSSTATQFTLVRKNTSIFGNPEISVSTNQHATNTIRVKIINNAQRLWGIYEFRQPNNSHWGVDVTSIAAALNSTIPQNIIQFVLEYFVHPGNAYQLLNQLTAAGQVYIDGSLRNMTFGELFPWFEVTSQHNLIQVKYLYSEQIELAVLYSSYTSLPTLLSTDLLVDGTIDPIFHVPIRLNNEWKTLRFQSSKIQTYGDLFAELELQTDGEAFGYFSQDSNAIILQTARLGPSAELDVTRGQAFWMILAGFRNMGMAVRGDDDQLTRLRLVFSYGPLCDLQTRTIRLKHTALPTYEELLAIINNEIIKHGYPVVLTLDNSRLILTATEIAPDYYVEIDYVNSFIFMLDDFHSMEAPVPSNLGESYQIHAFVTENVGVSHDEWYNQSVCDTNTSAPITTGSRRIYLGTLYGRQCRTFTELRTQFDKLMGYLTLEQSSTPNNNNMMLTTTATTTNVPFYASFELDAQDTLWVDLGATLHPATPPISEIDPILTFTFNQQDGNTTVVSFKSSSVNNIGQFIDAIRSNSSPKPLHAALTNTGDITISWSTNLHSNGKPITIPTSAAVAGLPTHTIEQNVETTYTPYPPLTVVVEQRTTTPASTTAIATNITLDLNTIVSFDDFVDAINAASNGAFICERYVDMINFRSTIESEPNKRVDICVLNHNAITSSITNLFDYYEESGRSRAITIVVNDIPLMFDLTGININTYQELLDELNAQHPSDLHFSLINCRIRVANITPMSTNISIRNEIDSTENITFTVFEHLNGMYIKGPEFNKTEFV